MCHQLVPPVSIDRNSLRQTIVELLSVHVLDCSTVALDRGIHFRSYHKKFYFVYILRKSGYHLSLRKRSSHASNPLSSCSTSCFVSPASPCAVLWYASWYFLSLWLQTPVPRFCLYPWSQKAVPAQGLPLTPVRYESWQRSMVYSSCCCTVVNARFSGPRTLWVYR